ncbi:MAG: DUF3662 and FHA domain-containing protein [Actinomycetota bacterium]|nr:DUF3662 and FHA domain-containing protein [Actinomycetota bacterium]
MGRLSQFEGKIDRAFDNAAGSMFKSPVSPVQMTKRAEKEMYREKLVSAGVQHAPTLFNILVNPVDDEKLSGFYPTLAGEMETYLKGKADEGGLHMDGSPLVRFIVDDKLKSGKFDVIAENVSASIIQQLRMEEMQRYGLDARDRGRDYEAEPPYDTYDTSDEDAYFAAQDEGGELAPQDLAPGYQPPLASLYNINTGETFNLDGVQVRIGRDRANDIVIRDPNVSRTHAEIVLRDGYWMLNDLGSTNGTFLNDKEIAQVDLCDGDLLTFGMTNFEFREG